MNSLEPTMSDALRVMRLIDDGAKPELILYEAQLRNLNSFNEKLRQTGVGLMDRQEQAEQGFNHLIGRVEAISTTPSPEELILLSEKIDLLEGIQEELKDSLEQAQNELQNRQHHLAIAAGNLTNLKGKANKASNPYEEIARKSAEFAGELTSRMLKDN